MNSIILGKIISQLVVCTFLWGLGQLIGWRDRRWVPTTIQTKTTATSSLHQKIFSGLAGLLWIGLLLAIGWWHFGPYSWEIWQTGAIFPWSTYLAWTVCLLCWLIGFTLWIQPWRRWLVAKFSLDDRYYLHRSVIILILVTVYFCAYSHSLGSATQEFPYGKDLTDLSLLLFSHFTFTLSMVCAGTGYPFFRKSRAVWVRLGLHRRPSVKVLLALFSLQIGVILLEAGGRWLSIIMGWQSLFQESKLPFIPWWMVLLVGLLPAIGEELLLRGLLQPRLGIWLTSGLFTILHTQYEWLPLLFVFGSSLLFGWAARRYGLWAAILMHATNNSIEALLQFLTQSS